MTTRGERRAILARARNNLFAVHASDVMIDLLTDSGTSAMSAAQWSALMQGDESYACAESFFRFEAAVKALMPFRHVIPTHQGRAAEAILCSVLLAPGQVVPSNTHFDTTRANIETRGGRAVDLPCAEGADPDSEFPFKGDADLERLERLLREEGEAVAFVMMTLTNNAGGGQPVSLANLEAVASLARRHGRRFFIDGCRFAENAWLMKQREPGLRDVPVPELVRRIFALADGMTMSAKKDAFANIGGWLALDDDDLALEARNRLVITEGFPTYGGLAGRDLEAIAVGLAEIVDEDYLRYRLRTSAYVSERLLALGVPVVRPPGGHAVFVDAARFVPHIPPLAYPGQSVAVALYEYGGVRACEIGSVMFGRQPDGTEQPARQELVRLALPRRVYTQSHADYLIEVFAELAQERSQLRGMRITSQPPVLRHFSAHFEPMAA
jgi:tryptophanase